MLSEGWHPLRSSDLGQITESRGNARRVCVCVCVCERDLVSSDMPLSDDSTSFTVKTA